MLDEYEAALADRGHLQVVREFVAGPRGVFPPAVTVAARHAGVKARTGIAGLREDADR